MKGWVGRLEGCLGDMVFYKYKVPILSPTDWLMPGDLGSMTHRTLGQFHYSLEAGLVSWIDSLMGI